MALFIASHTTTDEAQAKKYQDIRKIDLPEYSSEKAERVSPDEIESIILPYLEEHMSRRAFNNGS